MISTQHLMPIVLPTPALPSNGKTGANTPGSGMTSPTKDGGCYIISLL